MKLVRTWSRPPQLHDPEPYWMPIRYVHDDVLCAFCGFLILRTAPGRRTGERGTKAFYNAVLREWECIPCRIEAGRANEERNK
jgi:hypothetical protein